MFKASCVRMGEANAAYCVGILVRGVCVCVKERERESGWGMVRDMAEKC